MPSPDYARLGRYVRERREQLGLTQEEVAGRGGPSTATLRLIENVTGTGYRPKSLRQLADALRWTADSPHAVLYGGEPKERDAASQGQPAPASVTTSPPGPAAVPGRDVTIAGPPALGIDTLSVQKKLSEHDQRLEAEFLSLAARIAAALEQNPAATGADIFGEGTDLARTWDAKGYRTETRLALMADLSLEAKERAADAAQLGPERI
jgi:transcriptional regulator with XRE-family HTH domain